MDDDSDKTLDAVLGYLVGRTLKQQEILEALQMSRSRYFKLKGEGALITPNNLIIAAQNLGINEIDLLARFGLIKDESVLEYAEGIAEGSDHPRLRSIPGGVKSIQPPAEAVATTRERPALGGLRTRPGVPNL